MSEWKVEVVRIGEVQKHPNADTLSITQIHGGYPVIFRTGDFKTGDLAVYVPIDSLVPISQPEFAFLASSKGRECERVKAKKLRGIFSMGLIIPAKPGMTEGSDVAADYGVTKWEPPAEAEGNGRNHVVERKARKSETVRFDTIVTCAFTALGVACAVLAATVWAPLVLVALACFPACIAVIRAHRAAIKKPNIPVYDIDGYRKYKTLLQPGERVVITEKIHGCNARYIHTGKRFHVASRTLFREAGVSGKKAKDDVNRDVWHFAAEKYELERKMKDIPGIVLFGEVYGEVQDLKYDVPAEERVRFAAFDAMYVETREYLDHDDLVALCNKLDIPMVPVLFRGEWDESLLKMAEGKSTIAGHVREGIVIKPERERRDPHIGRVILKYVGEGYLLRDEKPKLKVAA